MGTIMVVGDTRSDRSAVHHGITFSSIHDSETIRRSRQLGILTDSSDLNASQFRPWWHPKLSVDRRSKLLDTIPASLRAQAQPFQWSAVDPACGIIPGESQTTCPEEVKNVHLAELYRRFD